MERRSFAFLALLASVCRGQDRRAVSQGKQVEGDITELATVEVQVSTSFGKHVGRALAILRGVGTAVQYQQLGETIEFVGIPFGLYDVELQAAGFSTGRERIGVYQHEVHIWLGLSASPIEETERPQVVGLILPHAANANNQWVRFVPLYGGDFVEDRVSESGKFHLVGLRPGRYVVLVFDQEKLIMTKLVEFPGGKWTLDLNL